MKAIEVVKKFLNSDVFLKPEVFDEHFHKDFKMHWHASSGYKEFDYQEYHRLTQSTASSYDSMRVEVSHLFGQDHQVATRFTVFVKTIENKTEEVPVGYFITIFNVKDNKILEIHQTSHPKTD